MSLGLGAMLLIIGGIVGICVGWAMRRDDSARRVEANRRYYEGRLAELAGELRLTQQPAVAPAATVVQHFHLPAGCPAAAPVAAQYLEVLPVAALERGWRA